MRSQLDRDARRAPVVALGFFVVGASIVAGCSQIDTSQVWPWSTVKSEKPQPGRMTVAWTYSTETDSGREMRGFRGRIFFYPKEKSKPGDKQPESDTQQPMKVEGALTVYAFDVTGGGKLSPAAPRKFFFVPDKLKQQCAESKQGPSYNVWLPWDGVGGPPQQVNLWARFDSINRGPVVTSDNSQQLLPGKPTEMLAERASAVKPPATGEAPRGGIEQTSYDTPAESPQEYAAPKKSANAATDEWWK